MGPVIRKIAAASATGLMALSGALYAQPGGNDVDPGVLPSIAQSRWLSKNPDRGSRQAMEIGKTAYEGNCASCHGVDMNSGGSIPDLRKLDAGDDAYFIERVRNGVQQAGITRMPSFDDVLDQRMMWAIRSYIDKRHYEYEHKDLGALYRQFGDGHGD